VRFFHRDGLRDLEASLRAERPEPSLNLIQAIVRGAGRSSEKRPQRSLRLAFATVTVAALAALGYVGGVSQASTSVGHTTKAVWRVFNFHVASNSNRAPESHSISNKSHSISNRESSNRESNSDRGSDSRPTSNRESGDDDDDDDDFCHRSSSECEYQGPPHKHKHHKHKDEHKDKHERGHK
jgi:hypothetical protein